MTRQQSQAWLFDLMASYFALRERPPAAQWVRDNIIIPPSVSPTHPGAFNPDLFPLANIVYDWFDDPQWREIVIVKSSQAGISQAFQNLTCYIGDYQLGDIMWLFESATKAKQINNERIKEMLRHQKFLDHVLPESEDDMQNFILRLKGLKVIMAGAQSASQNASRTVPFAFCDEGDEYPLELQGGESHAWTLIRERAKLIEHAKVALFSKPRNDIKPEVEDARLRNRKKKDDGIVWKEFLGGSRHKCFIPCIHEHCSEPFEIVWQLIKFGHCRRSDGVNWDFDKMLAETFIECPFCKRAIYDDDKVTQILKHREWRATNDGTDADAPVPGRMSAHISDLYVNSREFPTLSLGSLAIKCVSGKTDSDRKGFRRGNLALPVEKATVQKMQVEKVRRLCGTYERGTCPAGTVFSCLQIDVQENGRLFKWVKLAFALNDECFILDHGATEVGAEIASVMNKPIIVLDEQGQPSGRTIRCDGAWIDEGDGTCLSTVLDLCIIKPLYRRISTCKGRSGKQTENITDRVWLQKNRTHKGLPLDRYLVDHEYFMDNLYDDRIHEWTEHLRNVKRGADVLPPAAARLWFYRDAEDELLHEFCTDLKGWHLRNGRLVFGWPLKPEGGKNDYSDCVKDGLAMWYRTKPIYLRALAAKLGKQAASPVPS